MQALVLALCLAGGQTPSEAGDAAQIDRIRRALAEPPAIMVPPSRREGLVFRVTVHGSKSDRPIWEALSSVPSYIRPPMPIYHDEFLHQVTPEAFRAATLYPAGVPIGPLIEFLGNRIRTADRKMRETSARKEVRQALEELLACRADPDRPGC